MMGMSRPLGVGGEAYPKHLLYCSFFHTTVAQTAAYSVAPATFLQMTDGGTGKQDLCIYSCTNKCVCLLSCVNVCNFHMVRALISAWFSPGVNSVKMRPSERMH